MVKVSLAEGFLMPKRMLVRPYGPISPGMVVIMIESTILANGVKAGPGAVMITTFLLATLEILSII